MIDQVAAAFNRKDYKTAAQLLKQLQQHSPDHPWIRIYIGRLQEVSGKWDAAETAYRQVLQETTNPKITAQAREGLQRLEATAQARRKEAIAQATSDSSQTGLGFLVLEAIEPDDRTAAAQAFARIMNLDAYTARLQLPSRGWRLYRTGAIGELQFYGQALQHAKIPVFWVPLADIQAIRVFRVQYFQSVSPHATVICQNETDQMGSLTFDWSEVTHRIEGMLPVFEDVVDIDARNKLTRKEQTQDYAQVCDLHLPKRNCILRFGDWSYQFHQGVVFDASQDGETSASHITNRIRWNQLVGFLDDRLAPVPIGADFTSFAETALDHLILVKDLTSHIDLFRKAPTQWDPAFQLYSSLMYIQASQRR
jgi:hypothetical protein